MSAKTLAHRGFEISVTQQFLPDGRVITDHRIEPRSQETVELMGNTKQVGSMHIHLRDEKEPIDRAFIEAKRTVDFLLDDMG